MPKVAARSAKAPLSAATSAVRVRAVEVDAHEEIAGLEVVELLRLEDVEAAFEQSRRDLGDDSRPIGAGQREDMAGGGHRLP